MKKNEGAEGVGQKLLGSSLRPESVTELGSLHSAAALYTFSLQYKSAVMCRMHGTFNSCSWLF
jgi:hypothetical protein